MALYRDDLAAAQRRIETLEAQVQERDAALHARRVEIAELEERVALLEGELRPHGSSGAPRAGERPHRASGLATALLVALGLVGMAAWMSGSQCGDQRWRGGRSISPGARPMVVAAASPGSGESAGELPADVWQESGSVEPRELRDPFARPAAVFDAKQALAALAAASEAARACARPGGPAGTGTVEVQFDPNGGALPTLPPRFEGTAVGDCVHEAFGAARVSPFAGGSRSLRASFTIPLQSPDGP